MNNKFSTAFNSVKRSLGKHSPEILTGMGIAGMVTSTVLAVKATPKALKILEDAEYEKKDILTGKEKVKAIWKCYIPSAVSGAFGITCLVGSSSVNSKRNAALATAYKLSETAFAEYKEKVIETIGENKEKEIKHKVNQERLEKHPNKEVVIVGNGETMCFDVISSRYFKSSVNELNKAANEVNRRMISENYISLSEFYDAIGLSHTKNSDEIGWNLDDGFLELSFDSMIDDKDEPCIVVDYNVSPRYDFSALY